jgi:translation initiation factor IF-3
MKFRPKVDTHDYETKKKHILRFLDAGAKVKVTIMFRGREMAHPEQGLNILIRLAEELEDIAGIETQPKLEGRNMHMLIAPLRVKKSAAAKKSPAARPAAAAVSAGQKSTPAEPSAGATKAQAPEQPEGEGASEDLVEEKSEKETSNA